LFLGTIYKFSYLLTFLNKALKGDVKRNTACILTESSELSVPARLSVVIAFICDRYL